LVQQLVLPQLELVLALLVQQVLELLPASRLLAALAFAAQALALALVLDMVPLDLLLELLAQQVLKLALPLGLRLFVFDFDRPLNITSSTYKIYLKPS
jgi:hypothetical protein